jgi:hypothetical protein
MFWVPLIFMVLSIARLRAQYFLLIVGDSMRFAKFLLSAMASAVLVGCGGGGGGGGTPGTALSGVVAKGPATGAKVFVYATSNGKKGSLLGQTTTGAGGAYSLNLPPQSAPVLIEVDLAGATIEDEANNNATYLGKPGDVMKAVFVPREGSAQTIHVTPFSHMAAALVTDSFSVDQINAASAVVRQIVNNKDFLTVSPTEDTTGLKNQLTVLSKRATDGSGSSALQPLLTSLVGAVEKASDGTYQAAANFQTALCGNVQGCTTQFASTVIPVAPSPALNVSSVAKAVFQSLYETITALTNAGNTGEFDKALQTVVNASKGGVPFVDNDQLKLLDATNEAIDYRSTNPNASSNKFVYPWDAGYVCAYFDHGVGAQPTWKSVLDARNTWSPSSPGASSLIACKSNRYSFVGGSGGASNVLLVLPSSASGTTQYASLIVDVNEIPLPSSANPNIQTGSVSLGSASATTLSFVGKMAPSARIYRENGVSVWSEFNYSDIDITFTEDSANSASKIAPNSFIKVYKKSSTDPFQSLVIAKGELTPTVLNLDIYGENSGMKVQGVFAASGNGNLVPEKASFVGSIYQKVDGVFVEFLRGELAVSKTSQGVEEESFKGQILLKNRAPLGIGIAKTLTNDVVTSSKATFFWDGKSFSVTPVNGGGYSVASQDGVNFTVPQGGGSSTLIAIKVGDQVVGDFYRGKASFIDGSYFDFKF